ncbi:hypothetical protein BV898_02728 [Hypsibius exemplaris]|uniref:Bulb-type lectin domain-containing protein n=1 Tax=Hypsibius exemplaris TaxID=2072580 RepID=A0A1W0X6X7_HYPEX|nr:hypothetical protein BV898_02728 [Hypsibius exemplaris]
MWTSGTSSLVVKPVTLMVLSNGDIILLNDAGETVWKLGTAGKKYAGASLWLKNDGSLCLTMDQTSCLWSTSFSFQQLLKTNTDGTVTTATSLAMQKALKMPVVRGDAEILAHCLFFTNCSYSCRTDCDKNSGKLKQIVPAKNRNLRYTYYSCALQVPLDVKVHWKDSDGIVTKFFDSSRQDEVIATCAFYRGLWYECFGVSECTGLTSITQTCSAGSAPWTGFYQGSPAEGWRGNITQTAMNGSGSSRNQLSSNGDTGVIQTCN